jgi:acetyl esterase
MNERDLQQKLQRGETLTKDEKIFLEDLRSHGGPDLSPTTTGHHWRISCEEARPPDIVDVPYGPHERNKLDLWLAKSNSPTPLLICMHGGGFRAGSKEMKFAIRDACLNVGISAASINYRLSQHAIYPASMHDGMRALQFLRANASKWNLDPTRVAAVGNSAGAGIILWLGLRDDRAKKDSADPIERESTLLSCMVVYAAQTSYDPRFIKQIIKGPAWQHPAVMDLFGISADQAGSPPPDKAALMEDSSSLNFVTAKSPPAYLIYRIARDTPTENDPSNGIHHPNFGVALKQKMDALNLECHLRCMGDDLSRIPTELQFLRKHLKV